MNAETRVIVGTLLPGVALLAVLWFLAIAPARSESAAARANVAAQKTRLAAAKTLVAGNQSARSQFRGLMAELKRLDVAVPGRAAISDLLRELQRRARASGSDLRVAVLKSGAVAAPAATPAATAPATPAEPAATPPAEPAATPPATPAATPVAPAAGAEAGGLSTLPFTFEYSGKYFDLLQILKAIRTSVKVRASGDLAVGGRLLTVDGVTFNPEAADRSRTKAVISATAYIAPEGAASPQVPAGATTQGEK